MTINGGSQGGKDFTASLPAGRYFISGTTTLGGLSFSGVTVSAGGLSVTTDCVGTYLLGGLPNGTYWVMPSLSGDTFTPAAKA